MKKTTLTCLLSAAVLCLSLNPAEAKPKTKIDGNCGTLYKNKYLKAKGFKAFAMSEPLSDLFSAKEIACGGNDGNSSKADAKRRALASCNNIKSLKTVPGKCRIVDSK
jgi:hypothetical protein